MSGRAASPSEPMPRIRDDLIIRPGGSAGGCIVKDPQAGEYYELGEAEYYLLTSLSDRRSSRQIRAGFQRRFGQPLSEEELKEFFDLAASHGLIVGSAPPGGPSPPPTAQNNGAASAPRSDRARPEPGAGRPAGSTGHGLLVWRKQLFDPDQLFSWLAPRLWFFWTRTFLAVSAATIAVAMLLAWYNAQELVSYFPHVLRWETLVAAWLTLLLVTTCHEFAHGLTCKRLGGEVHDIGFLLIFLLPGFYCDVSDAWLFRKKSQRVLVTFAGGYFELFLWALAMIVWQLTLLDSLANYLAWVVATVAGVRVLFNFNPLLKLDGYYLLSDMWDIPNLRQRSWDYVASWLRCLLWGSPPPAGERRAALFLTYGAASWVFSLGLIGLLTWTAAAWISDWGGKFAATGVAACGVLLATGLFRGVAADEIGHMLRSRRARSAAWGAVLLAGSAALFFLEVEDRVGGNFVLRSATRAEVRAPLAGFLKSVHAVEGDRVSAEALLAQIDVPDLASRIAQKRAELDESQAALQILLIGPRPEAISQQQERVLRAAQLRDLARRGLAQSRIELDEDLAQRDQLIDEYEKRLQHAQTHLDRLTELVRGRTVSQHQLDQAVQDRDVLRARRMRALAGRRAREALGTREAEHELALREDALAEAEGRLEFLLAGSRAEEIEAARARVARLSEEVSYMEHLEEKSLVCAPVGGVIVGERLHERVGRHCAEGELLCEIEDCSVLIADIAIHEDHIARVKPGDRVWLKARATPFDWFRGEVESVAPTAKAEEVRSTVTVHCRLENGQDCLRPNMQGYARIYGERRSPAAILSERTLKFIRTQFWW